MSVSQAFVDTCYASYANGATATGPTGISTTIQCPSTEAGVVMPNCAGITSTDTAMGGTCRASCANDNNLAACASGARTYCSLHSSNLDCRCLRPDNTSFGVGDDIVDYNSLKNWTQTTGLGFSPQCAYAACNPGLQYMVVPPDTLTSCPSASVTCSVTGLTISLENVVAQNINLVSLNCGSSSISTNTASTTNSASGNVGTTTNPTFSGLTVTQWTYTGSAIGIIVVILVIVAVVGAFAAVAARSERRADKTLDLFVKAALGNRGWTTTKASIKPTKTVAKSTNTAPTQRPPSPSRAPVRVLA